MVPFYIVGIFVFCVVYTFYCLYRAGFWPKKFLAILCAWLSVHLLLSYKGFYLDTYSIPPRFLLLIVPPLISIILLFAIKTFRKKIVLLDIKWLVALSIVRIPVEMVLYFLMKENLVPQVITFEGRNWDLLSGITAIPLTYCFFKKGTRSKKWILVWNIVAVALLFNVVIHAVLSAPTPFQQISFSRPNIGVFYFPFVLLPGFIVPSVLFSHVWIYFKYQVRAKSEDDYG